jgi:hypothetical protein
MTATANPRNGESTQRRIHATANQRNEGCKSRRGRMQDPGNKNTRFPIGGEAGVCDFT